jgi:hypothetical protein
MMKDLTIAQAQANVERTMAREKSHGSRKRVPRQSAIAKRVAAEARRLELLQAAENVGTLPHHKLLDEWHRQHMLDHLPPITPKRVRVMNEGYYGLTPDWMPTGKSVRTSSKPVPMRTLAEVNRALLELKRQSLELQRECVALQQEVYKLLKKE